MRFRRKLKRRVINASLKPVVVTFELHPPLPFNAIHGLSVLQQRLQEQFIEDLPTTIPVDWNTIALLDNIVFNLKKASNKHTLGER